MANWIISFLFSLGVTVWLYAKFMHKTGNNSKSSIIASGVVGVILFFVSFMLLSTFSADK